MTNAAKFYAVADHNGPISVRINAETASEAREWFLAQDANFGDDCRTDAEDDLGFDGSEGMEQFFESFDGYTLVDSDLCGDHNWSLYQRVAE